MVSRLLRRSGLLALALALASPALPALSQGQDGKPTRAQKPEVKGEAKTDAKGAAKAKAGDAAVPGGAQALETFDDWTAYATEGKSRICYALSKPTSRQPANLKDTNGYLFVSFRPGENVRNEIALIMGFLTKDDGPAEAVIGQTTYALVTKERNAWVKNPAEEPRVVATMSRGQALVVKAASQRGNETTDRYSLKGFGPALERARKECS